MRLLITLVLAGVGLATAMPSPFTRELKDDDTGQDVKLAQAMLNRPHSGITPDLAVDGTFGSSTANAVSDFQKAKDLTMNSKLDEDTALALLDCCSADGYVDDGANAASYGAKYMFKIVIPLPSLDRGAEATAYLLDKTNKRQATFMVRTHGYNADGTTGTWPDYTNDAGCNQMAENCNTPTGLSEVYYDDSISPTGFRLTSGLVGNHLLLLDKDDPLRTGLFSGPFLHSFDATAAEWDDSMTMPNTAGTISYQPTVADVMTLDKVFMHTKGLVSIYLATSDDLLHPPGMKKLVSHVYDFEESTERFFQTGVGMTTGAVAVVFLLGMIGAAAMSKMGYRPEIFRLSAERFSLIVGDRFSTVRASTANAAGGEDGIDMAEVFPERLNPVASSGAHS